MASRSVSPGGALLRASRVFSIPPPLPKPMGELSAKAIFTSDTATLPHPIHLSITTPPSSRAKGDWGFKRPLPLRSTTKTSTPFIRVEAIDTFEHITEFGSSADHAISLKKWQEMGVAVTVPVHKNVGGFEHGERKSVFEDDMDSTVEPDIDAPRAEDVRWSFKGPWLAGMTDGDFNAYLTKQIGDKKSEFRRYLRKACARSLTAEARREAIGEEEPPVAVAVENVSEDQMTEYVKILRHDRTELYRLIRTFLDLPPAPTSTMNQYEELLSGILDDKPITHSADLTPDSKSPYAKAGPPKTHPSAGLAYSLTDAQAFNHPEFGPQRFKSPIQGRVVLPNNSAVGSFQPALGVGGFVTEVPAGDNHKTFRTGPRGSTLSNIPGVHGIEPNKVGGSKVYVEPVHAQVDSNGKVVMKVRLADSVAVAVKEGTTDQIRETPIIPRSTKPTWKAVPGMAEAALAGGNFAFNYGLSEGSVAGKTAAKKANEDAVTKDLSSLLGNDDKIM